MKKAILLAALILAGTCLGAQNITVTSPNGGEEWKTGDNHQITWTTAGITSGEFRIILFNGNTNLGTIAMNIPVSQHSFSWTVGHLIDAPDAGPGDDYRVKIRVMGEASNDFSDASFSISGETSGLKPVGDVRIFPAKPQFKAQQRPDFQVHTAPNLEVSELFYDYRNKRCEARVKNIGNAPFNGRFRWEWHTYCGSRTAYKDIPPSQAALLNPPNGMSFTFDCSPPLHECGIHAFFSIEPITDAGVRLNRSQMEKNLPRYEHTQFLMSDRRIMLQFLHGSVHLNANQGHTISANDAFDRDPPNNTATFDVVAGIRNCGCEAGRFDQWPALGLYWSVHHWPSNTYTMGANRFVPAGRIQSPLDPGAGISIERPLTLPIRSGRYELRFHLGSNREEHPVCSFYIRFADELTD